MKDKTVMGWTSIIILAVVVSAFVLVKHLGQISARAASEHLRRGAKVIDVRSPAEFHAQHIPNAINLPLSDLREQVSSVAPDKSQVLLLHCLSGGRSEIAKRTLRKLGYTQVFNLGSYSRAERIAARAG